MEIIYRFFPCDGLCGNYVEIPDTIARNVMKPNGTILPHKEILCQFCQEWWAWNIDYEIEPQYLLPPPR
jgi:hypothetical protein